jgi:hypothetical protein
MPIPLVVWGAAVLAAKAGAALGAAWGANKAATAIAKQRVSKADERRSEARQGLQSTADEVSTLINSVKEEHRKIRDETIALSDPLLAFYKDALGELPEIAKPAELDERLDFNTPDFFGSRPQYELDTLLGRKEDKQAKEFRALSYAAQHNQNLNLYAYYMFAKAGQQLIKGVGNFIDAHSYVRDVDKFVTECDYWKTQLQSQLIMPIQNFKKRVAKTLVLHNTRLTTAKPAFEEGLSYNRLTVEQRLAVQHLYHTTKWLYEVTSLSLKDW